MRARTGGKPVFFPGKVEAGTLVSTLVPAIGWALRVLPGGLQCQEPNVSLRP